MSQSPCDIVLQHLRDTENQDWPAVAESAAPDVRAHIGGQTFDRAGWVAMGQMFYAAFPDARFETERILPAGDDGSVWIGTWRGTHRGEFQGVPASGKSMVLRIIMVHRCAGGRIVEHWGQFDSIGLLQQIGAMPG